LIDAWEEDKVSFNRAVSSKKLATESQALQSAFDRFKKSKEYQYLLGLRNCIHHRWSLPICIESSFTVELPGPIAPRALPSNYTVLLPDRPDAPLSEISCRDRRELISTMRETMEAIERFAIDVYPKSLTTETQRFSGL
jgi:hypothetical protein